MIYPWRRKKHFTTRRAIARLATKSTTPLPFLAFFFAPGVALGTSIIAGHRFTERNDSWSKRGLQMIAFGILLLAVLWPFGSYPEALVSLLRAIGSDDAELVRPILLLLLYGFPFGFILQGIRNLANSYSDEIGGARFLHPRKPTIRQKQRHKKNVQRITDNTLDNSKALTFGVITDDPIPWRLDRYGMLCQKPYEALGHGSVVGASQTGKSVFAVNSLGQAVAAGMAGVYVDFKASNRTLERVRSAALRSGRKFYAFTLNVGEGSNIQRSWYDPLDWRGSPSEKASMVVNSLSFEESGSASYYRNIAEEWLTLQFEVLDLVGVHLGESSFDFLWATTKPQQLQDRLQVLRNSPHEHERNMFAALLARAQEVKPADLSSLRTNLATVVNAGGNNLRPRSDAPGIQISKAIDEGAVVYFGLSPSLNSVALKAIGSLIIRNLDVVSGERLQVPDLSTLRPVLAIVDEASRLGDRAVVMENLLTTSSEAQVFVWTITQSYASWPATTVDEIEINAAVHVAFRVAAGITSEKLIASLGTVWAMHEMNEGTVSERLGRGDVAERSGETRESLETAEPYLAEARYSLDNIPNGMAYVWFKGRHNRTTLKSWKSRRLPAEPDTTWADAPVIEVPLMDMSVTEEPVQGQEFVDMVTSPEDIERALQESTIRRTPERSTNTGGTPLPPRPDEGGGLFDDEPPPDENGLLWSNQVPPLLDDEVPPEQPEQSGRELRREQQAPPPATANLQWSTPASTVQQSDSQSRPAPSAPTEGGAAAPGGDDWADDALASGPADEFAPDAPAAEDGPPPQSVAEPGAGQEQAAEQRPTRKTPKPRKNAASNWS